MWSLKRKRTPYGRLVKHKPQILSHCVMNQWGVDYLDTYSQVVHWVYLRAMLTMIVHRELHTKSVYFVLAYTQAVVKSEISMEPPIGFGVEGAHPR